MRRVRPLGVPGTPRMIYAKKRAEWIQRTTKRHDNYLARELYQDAITDTWLCDVAWDRRHVDRR
jgi:hypothetical protein